MYLKFLTTEPKNSLFFHIQFFPVDEKISVWFFNFVENNYCSYATQKWFSILFLLKLNGSLHVHS